MLCRLFTHHQVMPAFLDFINVFGMRSHDRDLRFSSFREQSTISDVGRGLAVPCLLRSGQQYQLCYNLKSVVHKKKDDDFLTKNVWAIRQVAIHHQFDAVEGTTLWVIAKGNDEFKKRIERLTGVNGRPEDRSFGSPEECFRSSLAVHLSSSYWSTEGWRRYIQWLESVIDEEVR
jgi:hypothetical protein